MKGTCVICRLFTDVGALVAYDSVRRVRMLIRFVTPDEKESVMLEFKPKEYDSRTALCIECSRQLYIHAAEMQDNIRARIPKPP